MKISRIEANKKVRDEEMKKFRGKLGKRMHSRIAPDDKNDYYWLTTTTGFMNATDEYVRVEQAIEKDWAVVYSNERPENEHSNVPSNDKVNSERLKPVTRVLANGQTQILLKRPKELSAAHHLQRARDDYKKQMAATKTIKNKGGEVITSDDVDLNNPLEDE